MSRHEEIVQWFPETFQKVGDTPDRMCPIGTFVTVGADDPGWLAESFKPAITKFFRHWTDVRIQSLSFNGEMLFDHRLWPEPPVLEPITVKVAQPNIPEWKEPKDA